MPPRQVNSFTSEQYRPHPALHCLWEDPAFLMSYTNSCEQNHCFCIILLLHVCESYGLKVSNAIGLIIFDTIFVDVRNETIHVTLSWFTTIDYRSAFTFCGSWRKVANTNHMRDGSPGVKFLLAADAVVQLLLSKPPAFLIGT